MKRFALSISAAAIFAAAMLPTAAITAEDVMAPYYNATLIRMDAMSQSRTWYDKGGNMARFSYEKTLPEGSFTVTGVEGKWRLTGNPGAYKMCEQLNLNIPEQCVDFAPHKVGDAWDSYKQSAGGAERWQLVQGRTTH